MTEPSRASARSGPQSIADLRLRVTVNHFKRVVLGDLHVPGVAQDFALFEALRSIKPQKKRKDYADNDAAHEVAKVGMKVSQRSWTSWFSNSHVRPKLGSITPLDNVATELPPWIRPRDGERLAWPSLFYETLYAGGLLTSMLTGANPNKPRQSLLARATEYRPRSAWHLHLDALELRNFAASMGKIDADDIVKIAGARIFDLLYALWGDVSHPAILNTIYVQLRSDAQARWDAASEEQKAEVLADPLLGLYDEPENELWGRLSRTPNFGLLGRAGDVTPGRIYRMLFAIGSDSKFLQDEALSAWALDLATAGAAGVALYFAGSPYLKPHSEQVIINAIDSLMMGLHIDGVAAEHRANLWGGNVDEALRAAMEETGANWGKAGTANLLAARRAYETEMADLGVKVTDIYKMKQRRSLRAIDL